MRFYRYTIALLCAFLFVGNVCEGSVPPPNDSTSSHASKRKLLKANRRMAARIDSLEQALEEMEARMEMADTMDVEAYEMYIENEDKIGAGLTEDDYSTEVTDSLMQLWFKNRTNNAAENEYDMDEVHFTSNVSDATYLKRLEAMNSFITLPYNETVRNYIILYSEKMPSKMSNIMGLSTYYFPIFEEVFNKYNMPDELKYMAVIESALNPVAVSRAGAKGMWQFMYNTAKIYGLTINSYVDERLDPYKSADAAARYLRDAYGVFGDWNLAISSYNCGAGNVNKAIKRSGSRDFWSIYNYLPRETRGYVPAFVGAMYAFKYSKEHGLKPAANILPSAVDTFSINKMVHFRQISEVAGIPMETLREMNPQYIRDIIPGNEKTYILRLPFKYSNDFLEHEDSIYNYKTAQMFGPATLQNTGKSTSTYTPRSSGKSSGSNKIYYKVKKGDSLGKIAARYHVTINQIKNWNGLRSNTIQSGKTLVIYSRGGGGGSKSKSSGGYTYYTVRKGDTLSGIAAKYRGVTANDIKKANGLRSNNIQAGKKLKIPKK